MPRKDHYDLLIVGGGINGCGIARDAAGRGLDVLLCEQDDLAAHTSSQSTKLIHGGLRYLEQYDFRMVREALREREVLLNIAPHIVWPQLFVLPHNRHLRPAWMIRAGLFLYDHLAPRKRLPASYGIDLSRHIAGRALKDHTEKGFVYSDCAVLDSRLVILNARDAAQRGARILPRTACLGACRENGRWRATLAPVDGQQFQITADALVNATGPWVDQFIHDALEMTSRYRVRLVKGSHIIVPRLFDHDFAYIFQHGDGRVIFAIPYERKFTLVGTTDVEYSGDPANASTSAEEIAYLCGAINVYFNKQTSSADVISHYSGVRPLFDDGTSNASRISREYIVALDKPPGQPPLINLFGGKITAYRQIAEKVLDRLLAGTNRQFMSWTGHQPLPGGDIPDGDFAAFLTQLKMEYPWLPTTLAQRLARHYGTCAKALLGEACNLEQLGKYFGADLYEREVRYLLEHEWARSAEDILWRRTRLGLHLTAGQRAALERWMTDNV